MSNRVLLARPNDFIVNDVRAALVRQGFEVTACTSKDDLAAQLKQSWSGVVISTAVSSSVALSIGETYQLVRRLHANVPVAITTLSTLATVEATMKAEVPSCPPLVDATTGDTTRLHSAQVLLCVRRESLVDGTAELALKKHFAAAA